MASVTSLTATKIEELLAGWEGVSLSQDEINSLVVQLKDISLETAANMDDFNQRVRPQLEADLEASANAVSDLTEVTLPALQGQLDEASLEAHNMATVLIPSLREDMDATMSNVSERPNVYVQDEEPTNPDENDRELVVGDSWFDSNDNNRQRIWNGAEWSTFNVDVADFSLTAKSFFSAKHQIL